MQRDPVGALFYDRLLTDEVKLPDFGPRLARDPGIRPYIDRITKTHEVLKEFLPQAIPIRINNVHAYYMAQGDKQWEVEDDFPCLVPPFEVTWFEFRADLIGLGHKSVGVLMYSDRCETMEGPNGVLDYLLCADGSARRGQKLTQKFVSDATKLPRLRLVDEVDWSRVEGSKYFYCVTAFVVAEVQNQCAAPLTTFTFALNDQGQFLTSGMHIEAIGMKGDPEDIHKASGIIMGEAIFPTFLALTFIHCRNIQTVQPQREGKFQKIWFQKTGKPLVRYHEIQLTPIRKIIEGEGNLAGVGMKKALHTVRGHFVHYGEKYGTGKLFGKYDGRYFVPQHARGDLKSGEIKQSYNVKV
jgi:hypothetical protein